MELKNLTFLIGIFLFIVILFNINIKETISILQGINIYLLLLLLFLRFIYVLVKSISWKTLLSAKKIEISTYKSFWIYSIGLFIGMVTPGRVGDLIRVVYLKKDNIEIKKSLITVIIDRIFDLSLLFLLGYISMFFLMEIFMKNIYYLSVFIVLSIILILIVITNRRSTDKLLVFIINKIIPKKYKIKAHTEYKGFLGEIKSIKTRKLFTAFLISIIAWILYYFQMYLAVLALKINISFIYVIIIISIAGLVNLIPISLSGIGSRDLAFIYLFAYVGLSKEIAVSYSLLYLFLIFFAAIIGMFFWIKNPISIKKAVQSKNKQDIY